MSVVSMNTALQTAFTNLLSTHTKMCVDALAEKYGFDAREAMSLVSETVVVDKAVKATKSKDVSKSDKPKRATTGYILFGKEIRSIIKTEMPDLKPKEVISEIAKRWKELDSNGQEEWKTKAKTPSTSEDEADDSELMVEKVVEDEPEPEPESEVEVALDIEVEDEEPKKMEKKEKPKDEKKEKKDKKDKKDKKEKKSKSDSD